MFKMKRHHAMDLNSLSEMVQSLDKDGHIIDVSPKWLEETGYQREEVVGHHFKDFLSEDSLPKVVKNFPHLKDYGFVDNVPLRVRRKDNVVEEVVLNGTSRYDDNGEFVQTFCELRTLDFFKKSAEQIAALLAEERFLKAMANVKANVAQISAHTDDYQSFLIKLRQILSEPAEVDYACNGTQDHRELYQRLKKLTENYIQSHPAQPAIFTVAADLVEQDGDLDSIDFLLVMRVYNPMEKNHSSLLFMGIKSEIAQEKWVEAFKPVLDSIEFAYKSFKLRDDNLHLIEELTRTATTDALTGLCNRVRMNKVLQEQQYMLDRYHNDCALVMIDLDDFKKVNDTYGHNAGDEVLKEISSLIECHTRNTDIVGRWGGEEFLVVMPQTSLEHALAAAELLRQKVLQKEFSYAGHKTASFGVSRLHKQQTVIESIDKADSALYQAKTTGKNRVCSCE